MLSDLLDLIDRLIQLFEYRNKRFKMLYQDLLKPTFDNLLLIHADYIKIFEETRNLLPSYSAMADPLSYIDSLNKPAEFLQTKRLELEPARRKLKILAERLEMEAGLDPDVRIYVGTLVAYFTQAIPAQGTASVGVLNELKRLASKGQSESESLTNAWQAVDRQLWDLLAEHRERYAHACESFAPLQIRAAKTP